jgi:hypothetical protein
LNREIHEAEFIMTRFGKLLIFMQVGLSMLMLTWAVGITASRVNWSPRRSFFGGEPVPGQVTGDINGQSVTGSYDELVANLLELRDQSQEHWQSAHANFKRVDDQRLAYLDWYADQNLLANTGKDRNQKALNPPVIVLKRGPDGLLNMDEREPVLAGKVVVKSVQDYQNLYKKIYEEVEDEQRILENYVKQLKEVTEEIAGIPGKTPGLRGQLLSEITFFKLHQDEMAYLAPQLNARRVESQVLERRLKYLHERRKELYAALGIEPEGDGR